MIRRPRSVVGHRGSWLRHDGHLTIQALGIAACQCRNGHARLSSGVHSITPPRAAAYRARAWRVVGRPLRGIAQRPTAGQHRVAGWSDCVRQRRNPCVAALDDVRSRSAAQTQSHPRQHGDREDARLLPISLEDDSMSRNKRRHPQARVHCPACLRNRRRVSWGSK